MNEAVLQISADFNAEINAAFGLYLDATMGFAANLQMAQRLQDEQADANDASTFLYGSGPPGDPNHRLLHQTTYGALKDRNRDTGENYVLLTRFLIVLVYGLWETGYRSRLASAAGRQANELQSPIFGDLRLLRHEILHNKGRIDHDTRRRLEIVGIGDAESVRLDDTGVEQLVQHVKAGLDAIVEHLTGIDPGYRTIWRLAES